VCVYVRVCAYVWDKSERVKSAGCWYVLIMSGNLLAVCVEMYEGGPIKLFLVAEWSWCGHGLTVKLYRLTERWVIALAHPYLYSIPSFKSPHLGKERRRLLDVWWYIWFIWSNTSVGHMVKFHLCHLKEMMCERIIASHLILGTYQS